MTPTSRRRADGVYYTPQPIVEYIVRQTLAPLFERPGRLARPPRVLDPSCGDGAFLRQVFCHLRDNQRSPRFNAGQQLYGVDVDHQAVEAARQTVLQMATVTDRTDNKRISTQVARNVCCGDALVGTDFSPDARLQSEAPRCTTVPFNWPTAFPEVAAAGGFDAIVGNPPYVNIRVLTKTRGIDVKRYLESQFRCARRAYDLYVLFLERALALLRPGGMCGMIVPNKIAASQYALPCRALLLEQTELRAVADLSEARIFPGAGVYPYVLVFQKQQPQPEHKTNVYCIRSIPDLSRPPAPLRIRQRDQSADCGFQIHGRLDVEARVPTLPLGDQARLYSGTTGFAAQKILAALKERRDAGSEPSFDFIVSRNIDRFAIQRGKVRFMKRDFRWPVLPIATAELTERKRRMFAGPKIVFAGMSRRLEAALDEQGLALGVQVYAACDLAADPRFLLGLLNSKLLSYLFSIRYRAKRLAGGYLAINKSQLAQLPIRIIQGRESRASRLCTQLAEYVDRMLVLCCGRSPQDSACSKQRAGSEAAEIDQAIDHIVYQLYALTKTEIKQVEAAVEETRRSGSNWRAISCPEG